MQVYYLEKLRSRVMRHPSPIPKFVVPPPSSVEPSSASPPIELRLTFVESFLAARDLQPKSVRSYRQDLQQFMDWCDRPWNAVSQRQVIGFKTYLIGDRKLSMNMVRRILQTLKSFYRWMERSGHVTSDPIKEVQLPKSRKLNHRNCRILRSSRFIERRNRQNFQSATEQLLQHYCMGYERMRCRS